MVSIQNINTIYNTNTISIYCKVLVDKFMLKHGTVCVLYILQTTGYPYYTCAPLKLLTLYKHQSTAHVLRIRQIHTHITISVCVCAIKRFICIGIVTLINVYKLACVYRQNKNIEPRDFALYINTICLTLQRHGVMINPIQSFDHNPHLLLLTRTQFTIRFGINRKY